MNRDHPATSQPRLALVDDDAAIRDAMGLMLQIAGYEVVTFSSATSFLASRPAHLDCLILDHHMPSVTGLELAARLRDQGDPVRILLITGAPSPAIFRRANELRIEKVLEKPPAEEELLQFIEGR